MRIVRFFAFFLAPLNLVAQPNNWKSLDHALDGMYGVSADRAYTELLKDRRPDTVIVAIIDDGMDVNHEALSSILWVNKREDGNDSDRNRYRGDFHGWNFLGGADGRNLTNSGFEYERLYFQYADIAKGKLSGKLSKEEREVWRQVQRMVTIDSIKRITLLRRYGRQIVRADSLLRTILAKDVYAHEDLMKLPLETDDQKLALARMRSYLGEGAQWNNQQCLESLRLSFDSAISRPMKNPLSKRRDIIGDNYRDLDNKHYGNNNLNVGSVHGTHVAGIIGAVSDNNEVNGIASAVKLMPIRAVPNEGDEYDKDVALAIRYAVDNGAKVINMSFSKQYSAERRWVEDAIRYAAKRDVLVIKGAGNDKTNLDSIPVYPSNKYIKGEKYAPNMIVVGASGPTRENLIASFSNYGKKSVDVFAPGVDIYSTLPENQYGRLSGTSMAAPVVSGLAAIIRSYFPSLNANQVKEIIIQSVLKIDNVVSKPGSNKKVSMSDLCVSGGIVNAMQAIQLAQSRVSRQK